AAIVLAVHDPTLSAEAASGGGDHRPSSIGLLCLAGDDNPIVETSQLMAPGGIGKVSHEGPAATSRMKNWQPASAGRVVQSRRGQRQSAGRRLFAVLLVDRKQIGNRRFVQVIGWRQRLANLQARR